MLASLFPDHAVTLTAEPWMWETPLSIQEECFISNAVDKRQREFRAGRHCAHKALEYFGIANGIIPKGPHREPQWPTGFVGSISHTQTLCTVAVCSKQHTLSLGHDVEYATPLTHDILPLICCEDEQLHIKQLGNYPAPLCKIIFSAKESLHKTYFPLNKHTLDFLDAKITLNVEQQSFKAEVIHSEPYPKYPLTLFHGKFAFDQHHVYTGIYVPAQTK